MKNDQNWVIYEVKPHVQEIGYFDAIYVITSKVSKIWCHHRIYHKKNTQIEKVHFWKFYLENDDFLKNQVFFSFFRIIFKVS